MGKSLYPYLLINGTGVDVEDNGMKERRPYLQNGTAACFLFEGANEGMREMYLQDVVFKSAIY